MESIYPSHDIGHFPVEKIILQADYVAYISSGQDNRPKGSSIGDGNTSSEEDQAAAKIQAVQRGNAARQELKDKQEAAAKIQAVQRGNAARQELKDKQEAAAKYKQSNEATLHARN